MPVTVTIGTGFARLTSALRGVKERQFRYAVANALNDTAKEVQQSQRRHVAAVFTLRNKREFILRQSAVIRFARPSLAFDEVRIRVGDKRGLLLPLFETGGRGEPAGGARTVPVPIEARPSKEQAIPPALYVRRLFERAGRRRGAAGSVFRIPGVGLFLRKGREAFLEYVFKPFTRLDRRLGFIARASGIARSQFPIRLRANISEAIAHNLARGR